MIDLREILDPGRQSRGNTTVDRENNKFCSLTAEGGQWQSPADGNRILSVTRSRWCKLLYPCPFLTEVRSSFQTSSRLL
jgi:hypothetical protein